jgi:hypothetical protein
LAAVSPSFFAFGRIPHPNSELVSDCSGAAHFAPTRQAVEVGAHFRSVGEGGRFQVVVFRVLLLSPYTLKFPISNLKFFFQRFSDTNSKSTHPTLRQQREEWGTWQIRPEGERR